jgi:hypothetical protein
MPSPSYSLWQYNPISIAQSVQRLGHGLDGQRIWVPFQARTRDFVVLRDWCCHLYSSCSSAASYPVGWGKIVGAVKLPILVRLVTKFRIVDL